MKKLVWGVTAFVLAVWSVVAWLVHGLIGMAGGLIAGNTDVLGGDPVLLSWAHWLSTAGQGVGEWLVIGLWVLVSLVILGLGYVVSRLAPDRGVLQSDLT